jgi:hypothetical protein
MTASDLAIPYQAITTYVLIYLWLIRYSSASQTSNFFRPDYRKSFKKRIFDIPFSILPLPITHYRITFVIYK